MADITGPPRPRIYTNVKTFREVVIALQQVVTAVYGNTTEAYTLNASLNIAFNQLDTQALLLADGSELLLEDDVEPIVTGAVWPHADAFFLENNDVLLLEDGATLLVEDGRYTAAVQEAQDQALYMGVGTPQGELATQLLSAPPAASELQTARD